MGRTAILPSRKVLKAQLENEPGLTKIALARRYGVTPSALYTALKRVAGKRTAVPKILAMVEANLDFTSKDFRELKRTRGRPSTLPNRDVLKAQLDADRDLTQTALAARYGVTPGAVSSAVRRDSGGRGNAKLPTAREIMAMVEANLDLTSMDLREQYDVSGASVSAMCQRNGIKLKRSKHQRKQFVGFHLTGEHVAFADDAITTAIHRLTDFRVVANRGTQFALDQVLGQLDALSTAFRSGDVSFLEGNTLKDRKTFEGFVVSRSQTTSEVRLTVQGTVEDFEDLHLDHRVRIGRI